jgi:hypothetical protein
MVKNLVLLVVILFSSKLVSSQETIPGSELVSKKYLDVVSSAFARISQKMDKKAEKILRLFRKQEEKLIRKLSNVDSMAAKKMMAEAKARYKELEERVKGNAIKQYIPQLDSLSTSLSFLKENPQYLKDAKALKDKLTEAAGRMDELKAQLHKTEEIKAFLKERREYLKQQLGQLGMLRDLKKINKQVYYYAQQVNEYKEALKDPKKAGKKALELLARNGKFRDFMQKNSILASLFPMPAGSGQNSVQQAAFAGLQTRAQLTGFLQQNGIGSTSSSLSQLQQNIQNVQAQISQVNNELPDIGGQAGEDFELPSFRPNSQKTKSILKRLEYGANFQSQKASYFFPSTTDLGMSLGFKLNDNSVIGIGASYKLGWGRGWDNIRLTNQGIGLRSFLDFKIKTTWWICGGYEQNYKTVFNSVQELKNLSAWQTSGLMGISKKVSLKSKYLKSTKIQLLWDFLSYTQVPANQPFIIRFGYNFK